MEEASEVTAVTPSTSPRPTSSSFRSGVEHKLKFLTGTEKINHDSVYNLRPKILTSDTSPLACSAKWFAVPYEGGGGPVYVSLVDAVGKVEPTTTSVVNGHKGPVYACGFSPFGESVLATAGDDGKVNVWSLADDIEGSTQQLMEGTHNYGARDLAFHPTVKEALVTTGANGDAILWDVGASQVARKFSIDAGTAALDWTYDGSLLLASCRDKKLRGYDIRAGCETPVWETEPHLGSSKSFRAKSAFVNGQNFIVSAGNPARKGGREVAVLDLRAPTDVVTAKTIDSQNGAMMPYFDEVTGVLWLWGRGDTTVRHLEMKNNNGLSAVLGHEFRTAGAGPHVGFAALPSRTFDVPNLQVAKFLRLTSTTVERVAFTLPRTPELKAYFNDDIYNDARTDEPSASVASWLDDPEFVATPKTTSLRPEGMPLLSEKQVETVVLNTQIVNEKLKIETQQKNDDNQTYERLTALANQYEKYQPNKSMNVGAQKGVDAAIIDGGEVDDDEWDD